MQIPITTTFLKKILDLLPDKQHIYEGSVQPILRYPLIEFTTTLTEGDKQDVSYKSYDLEFKFDFTEDDWTMDIITK